MADIDYSKYGGIVVSGPGSESSAMPSSQAAPQAAPQTPSTTPDYSKYGGIVVSQGGASTTPQAPTTPGGSVISALTQSGSPVASMIGRALFSPSTWNTTSFAQRGQQDVQGAIQGLRELNQNMQQAVLPTSPYRTAQIGQQRAQYAQTPAAQNAIANEIQGAINPANLAMMAITHTALNPETSMLRKMITGGTIGGTAANLQTISPDQSRVFETLKGAGLGAAAPYALEAGMNLASDVNKAQGLSAAQQKLAEIGAPFAQPIEAAQAKLNALQEVEPGALPAAQARLAETQTAAQQAEAAHQQSVLAEQQAKANAVQTPGVGSSDVNILKRNTQINEQKLAENNAQAAALQEPISTVGEAPTANIPEVKTPTTVTSQNILNAQTSHDNAARLLGDSENQISTYLRPNESHDELYANRINALQQVERDRSTENYNAIDENFRNHNVTLANQVDVRRTLDQLAEAIRNGNGPEAARLTEAIQNANRPTTVNARDYLAAVRTTRDAAREARQQQYQVGLNEQARMAAGERADNLQTLHNTMMNTLENGVGTENMNDLVAANNHYRDNIAVLHRNPIYQQIRFGGKVNSENIAKAIRGTDRGMVYLRNLTMRDPEAMRSVIAQRFSKNPNNLYHPNDTLSQYINRMPELRSAINQRNNAAEAVNNTETQLRTTQAQHKVSIAEEKAASTAQKTFEKQQTQHEKEQQAFETEKQRHQDLKQSFENRTKDLEQKLGQLKGHIDTLQERANTKGQTLQQKTESQKDLKDAKEAYKALTTGRDAEVRKAKQAVKDLESGKKEATAQAERHIQEIEDARDRLWGRFKKVTGMTLAGTGYSKARSIISKLIK